MKATVHLSIVCVGLALAGCQSAKTSTAEDAAPPAGDVANQDAVAPAPDLATPAPDLATPAPDLATPAPDLAAPAPDLAAPAPDLAAADAPLPADAAKDTAADTTSSSPDMAAFCTGGASKMVVNGISSTPTVTGKLVPYDCCDGAEFDVVSTAFDPIVVSWQAQSGAFKGFSTIDLATPATGWSVFVLVGCTSTLSCSAPMDSYSSGLVGSLSVSIGKSDPYDMSICLHAEESTSSAHPVVHSLDLFATHIGAK